jgi:hypothetical protein
VYVPEVSVAADQLRECVLPWRVPTLNVGVVVVVVVVVIVVAVAVVGDTTADNGERVQPKGQTVCVEYRYTP